MFDLDKYGDQTAVISAEGRLSYSELNKRAREAALRLLPGSVVFIVCENALPPLEYYLGALLCHAVPALLPEKILPQRLNELIDVYDPEAVVLPASRSDDADGQAVHAGGNFVLKQRRRQVAAPVNPGLALLITTSGSTGSPKFVRISRSALETNTWSIIKALAIMPGDRAITSLPMNYTYGLSVINTHLASGAAVVLTSNSVLQRGFWDLCRSAGVTSLSGVPYTYEMLRRLRFERMDLPSLKVLTQAGGHLPEALQKEFVEDCLKKGRRFYVMYGASEATARMAVLPYEQAALKIGSCGKAMPGGELFIEDDSGSRILVPGVVGRLCYRGPNVAMGYALNRADLAAGDEWQGLLNTGDAARFDEDGYFYITDRLSRFLKITGNRYSLDDAERVLKEAFPDCELACTGKDDLLVVVAVHSGLQDSLKAALPHLLHLNMRNVRLVLLDAIPRTPAGKTDYQALKGCVQT